MAKRKIEWVDCVLDIHGITKNGAFQCTRPGGNPENNDEVIWLPGKNKNGDPFVRGNVLPGKGNEIQVQKWLAEDKGLDGKPGAVASKQYEPAQKQQDSLKDILRKAYGMAEDPEVKRHIAEAGKLLK